jgi:nicotinate-nucleotide adenylyltransferase
MRVAFFGGSFNPPHVAHQLVALYALETAAVDELWMVPCLKHPFDKALAPFPQRLRMCELAAAALGPRARVSDIEGRLGGESRTLLTIKALRTEHPDCAFHLVVGADIEAELPRGMAPKNFCAPCRASWSGGAALSAVPPSPCPP